MTDAMPVRYVPVPDRVERVVGLALRLAALRRKPNAEKRIAFVLTNSPAQGGAHRQRRRPRRARLAAAYPRTRCATPATPSRICRPTATH